MSFSQGLNTWLSIICKGVGLVLVVVVVGYAGISIWGNISINNAQKEITEPGVGKATYEFLLVTTGEKLLTSEYETPGPGRYTLNGFYSLERNKWRWHEDILTLDEFYEGKILVRRR